MDLFGWMRCACRMSVCLHKRGKKEKKYNYLMHVCKGVSEIEIYCGMETEKHGSVQNSVLALENSYA